MMRAGESAVVTVQAVTHDGAPTTNCPPDFQLFCVQPLPVAPVITEVFRQGSVVEVGNLGLEPLDLSDWELQAFEDYPSPFQVAWPNAHLRIPPGTILLPGAVFTWSDSGQPPGAFPAFVSSKPFVGKNRTSFYLLRLVDPKGTIVDEVYLHSFVFSHPSALWKGQGLSWSSSTNLSHNRVGLANHFNQTDWSLDTLTLGSLSSNLALPWTNSARYRAATPANSFLTNGTWTGSVAIPSTVSGQVQLSADTGVGISGNSLTVSVVPMPALALSLVGGAMPAHESKAGHVGYVSASIPQSLTHDLTVVFTLNATNEFAIATTNLIPAGATNVLAALTNCDDAVADGTAVIVLSASATEYAEASMQLQNIDDEAGKLFVQLPPGVPEDAGLLSTAASVWLDSPARHDVLISLSAEPPLEVEESVIIPAGRISSPFLLRVEDDALVNPSLHSVAVRAQTGEWPPIQSTLTVTDDEDGSFTLSVPSSILEGATATGLIQVNVPRQEDTVFTVGSSCPRLGFPREVTLEAGALLASFPMTVTNDTTVQVHWDTEVCAETPGPFAACAKTMVLDDELDITGLTLRRPLTVVLSEVPFPFHAILGNFHEQPQVTNTLGRLDLHASPTVVSLAEDPNPIAFTNGMWARYLTMVGEGLQLRLSAQAAGFQVTSEPFDVLRGADTPFCISDAVYSPATGLFLIAEAAQTNLPARLTEFDPRTATRGRSLNLPRPVQRISISEDGQVAWLASTTATLQKVDIAKWQFAGEYPVEPGRTNGLATHLLVLPGDGERLLAITTTNRQKWQAVVYQSGLPAMGTNRANLSGGSVYSLLRGRTPEESFCQVVGTLYRFLVNSNAVVIDKSVRSNGSPMLTLANGLLYQSSGGVISADTLEAVGGFDVENYASLGMPIPERNLAVFVSVYGTFALHSYDLNTHAALGSHGILGAAYRSERLLRWGDRGFAMFSVNGQSFHTFESPLLNSGQPDLALTSTGPDSLVLPDYDNSLFTFTREFSVTNRGSFQAPGVILHAGGVSYSLGTMAPGEGVVVVVTNQAVGPRLVQFEASAVSALADANPQDNAISVVTRVRRPAMTSSRDLTLGMSHLVAAPAGDRLYAAVSRRAGELMDGVVVVDPSTGTIERTLPVGTDPRRMAISSDGTRLYVQLGTNSLVRWNLVGYTQDLSLTLTQDSIVDFAALPHSVSAFVLASRNQVAVYDDAVSRNLVYTGEPKDRRYVGFASGKLWVAEPGQLTPFEIGSSGLLPSGATVPFTLFSDWYRFTSDGRVLFFPGTVFDTVTGQTKNVFMGDQITPDAAQGSLYSAVGQEFRNYAPDSYELRGSQTVYATGGFSLQDPVRWGDGGLAARAGAQLIILDSAVVPSTSSADLAVTVIPPATPLPYVPMEWTVILTNRSDLPAPRTFLEVDTGGLRDFTVSGAPHSRCSSLVVVDLGTFPAHGSLTLKLHGWNFQGPMTISATTLTASADANKADNRALATIVLSEPEADLAIVRVDAPEPVRQGDAFQVTVELANKGPGTAANCRLALQNGSGLRFLGVAGGSYATNEYGVLLERIEPGMTKIATLSFQAIAPGLGYIITTAEGAVTDPVSENNRKPHWIWIQPTNSNHSITEMSMPGPRPIYAWDYSCQKLLATFPEQSLDLFVLDPWTLQPTARTTLPESPLFVLPCNNGRHAWVLLSSEAVRLDLASMRFDLRFSLGSEPTPVFAAVVPPGESNMVVAAVDPGWLGNTRLRVYDNGVPRLGEYGPLGWTGGGLSLLFTSSGRFFVGVSQFLRELVLTSNGFTEVQNLDAAGAYDGVSLSYASGRLFFAGGRYVETATGAFDDQLWPSYPLAADEQTALLYTASGSTVLCGGPPMFIQSRDASTLAAQWRAVIELPASDVSGIVPLGTNGCLVLGSSSWHVRPSLFGTPVTDLVLSVSNAPESAELDIPVPLTLSITNASVWVASGAALVLEPGPGLTVVDPLPEAGGVLRLGDLAGSTNITIHLLPTQAGYSSLTFYVTNSLNGVQPARNSITLGLQVLPPPVFQFDDTTVLESGYYSDALLRATLSRPAPTNMSAAFVVTPLSAQAGDFLFLSGEFVFTSGSITAYASIIAGNNIPELDKTARISFSSTNLTLARTNVLLTIANDDFPDLTVTNCIVTDGGVGLTNAVLSLRLSSPAPFPVSGLFQLLPGTATPGLDYLPRQGWVYFAPGTTSQSISVPVVDDDIYEPVETAFLVLMDAVNASMPSPNATLSIKSIPKRPSLRLAAAGPGTLQIEFESESGATYQLQSRTNLVRDGWKIFVGPISGTGTNKTVTFPKPAQSAVYYRLVAW